MRAPARIRRLAVPFALVLIAAAADVVVYTAVLLPTQEALARTDGVWQRERERIAKFKTYQQAHAEVTALAERATARDDLPKVVTTFASLAKRRGLAIPDVKYQPERTELKDFQKVSLTFSLSGPYANVRRFLDDLERSSPFFAVETLALARARKEQGDLQVQVRVAAYLRST